MCAHPGPPCASVLQKPHLLWIAKAYEPLAGNYLLRIKEAVSAQAIIPTLVEQVIFSRLCNGGTAQPAAQVGQVNAAEAVGFQNGRGGLGANPPVEHAAR